MCHKPGLNKFKAKDFWYSCWHLNQGNNKVRWGSSFLQDKPLHLCAFKPLSKEYFFSLQQFQANIKLKGKWELLWVPRNGRAPCKILFPEPHVCSERHHEKETQNSIYRHGYGDMIQHTIRHREREVRIQQHEKSRTHQTKLPSNPVSCLCEWPIAKEDFKKEASVYWECFLSCQAVERQNCEKNLSSDFKRAFALDSTSQVHLQQHPLSGGSAMLRHRSWVAHAQSTTPN